MNSSLVREVSTFARLWIRTAGCLHSIKNGGCIACDYWVGPRISAEEQITAASGEIALLEIDPPSLLLLETNGSVLDKKELNRDVRIEIFEMLRKRLPDTTVIIETRVETIDEDALEDLSIFPAEKIKIELGIETASPLISFFCCNKGIDVSSIPKVVRKLTAKDVKVLANVLIGLPFLTPQEIVTDVHDTIKWCFSNGISTCVLFPINLKPYTTLKWLYEHNYYRQISLWALIEVLIRLEKDLLENIEISWYPGSEQITHPHYKMPILTPSTCKKCAQEVNESLNRFAMSTDARPDVVQTLASIKCVCRDNWERELSVLSPTGALNRRLLTLYPQIALEAFGKEWVKENENVLHEQLAYL